MFWFKFSPKLVVVLGSSIHGHFPHHDSMKKHGNEWWYRAVPCLESWRWESKAFSGTGVASQEDPALRGSLVESGVRNKADSSIRCLLGSVGCLINTNKTKAHGHIGLGKAGLINLLYCNKEWECAMWLSKEEENTPSVFDLRMLL